MTQIWIYYRLSARLYYNAFCIRRRPQRIEPLCLSCNARLHFCPLFPLVPKDRSFRTNERTIERSRGKRIISAGKIRRVIFHLLPSSEAELYLRWNERASRRGDFKCNTTSNAAEDDQFPNRYKSILRPHFRSYVVRRFAAIFQQRQ